MPEFDELEPTAQGTALFNELLWVHSAIRRDLETVRRLAAECLVGRDATELQSEIKRLETNGPLWQLKVNCLRYCSFVHSHHNAEDVLFFPRIRSANPKIGPVVDRLESEHRQVSELLEEVEESAQALTGPDGAESRRRLSDGLTSLADLLLEHLGFEEENLRSTVVRMSGL